MKPIIGITTLCEHRDNKVHSSINYNYSKSVNMAGGTPILIPSINSDEDIENYLNTIDALLLSGGEDISPLLYGENPIKQVTYISPDRDEYETKLYLGALQKDMPILGICRGIQLMNSVSGGTLYQDINTQAQYSNGHSPMQNLTYNFYHTVNIEKDSKLFEIFKSEELKVNSFHHQAVNKVADKFKVTAKSPDGIIEGIENLENTFVLGVQWHPEDLTVEHPEFLKLFKTFIDEASKYKESDERKCYIYRKEFLG